MKACNAAQDFKALAGKKKNQILTFGKPSREILEFGIPVTSLGYVKGDENWF
jgi:hypothetical protein